MEERKLGNNELFVIATVLISSLLAAEAKVINADSNLREMLFSNNNKHVRPILNSSHSIDIYIEFIPFHLSGVNEKDQYMSFYGIMVLGWYNQFLGWNASEYGHIKKLVVDANEIWTPSIGIQNSIDKFFDADTTYGMHPVVSSDGFVVWAIGGRYRVTCSMDTSFFPYDEHNCSIIVASWSFSDDLMKFQRIPRRKNIYVENFKDNGEWELIDTYVSLTSLNPSELTEDRYPHAYFTFYVKRKATYYLYNVVAPLSLTIILVPMVFLLPPDSGEKLSLGVTVLLALSVFLLALRETTPETSDSTPMITVYVTFQMGLTSLSIITSVIVLRIYYIKHKERPNIVLRWIVLKLLGKLFCKPNRQRSKNGKIHQNDSPPLDIEQKDSDEIGIGFVQKKNMALSSFKKESNEHAEMIQNTLKMLKRLDLIVQKFDERAEVDEVSAEWIQIAVILDWVFFWLNCIAISLGTFFIYTGPLLGFNPG